MTAIVALVGRPNVGKSTLFNLLTRSRDALVATIPGLTRDRHYGTAWWRDASFVVVDTGGLAASDGPMDEPVARQTWRAVAEASAAVFLVDGREGLVAADQELAEALRRLGKVVLLAVNKTDGLPGATAVAEFYGLGVGEPVAISATRGKGIDRLVDRLCEAVPACREAGAGATAAEGAIALAIVGRPNVGKSTLANRLLGEERMLASELPGTTRDSIRVPFRRDGQDYLLIDTAGVRRRSRSHGAVEKFSIVKTLQAIEECQVVVLVADARQGIAEQDARLLGHVSERGRALVLAVNKWDRLEPASRALVRREVERRLGFADYARVHYVSALYGSGLAELLASVASAHAAATRDLATPELNRVLEQAVRAHQPPLSRGRGPKLRYAHQGGHNPPVVVVHGSRVDAVPAAYRRYLARSFRDAFALQGTPVRVELKAGENPYAPGAGRRPSPPSRRRQPGARRRR